MRSALDYLVYQLVRLDGGKPSTATAWPVVDEKPVGRSLSRYNAMLKGVKNKDALTMIDWFQPYKKPSNPIRENLALISKLDNVDKHRLVRPGVAKLTALMLGEEAIIAPGEVREGKELFRVLRSMGMGLKYDLAFWEQQITMHKLNELLETVQGVIDKVAVFFGSPG
jgi:hypothetical protein